MALLGLMFFLILVVAFTVMMLLLRVSPEERAIEDRLASLQTANGPHTKQAAGLFKDNAVAKAGAAALLGRLKLMRQLQQLTFQATGKHAAGSTVILIGASALAGMMLVLLITGMAPVAAVAGVLCGALPVARLYRMRQKRVRAFESVLPDSIDMCGRALRAGHSLVAAIGMVAEDAPEPAKAEFAEIYRKQSYGLSLADAFAETMERIPSGDLRVFVTGILVQKDTGGNLTEIFDRIVHVIRERMRIQGEIRVHTTQGRLTGWILTLLPLILLVLINLLNPGYSKPLFTDPTGKKLLYTGMGLLLLGGVAIRRIVNGIEV